MTICIAAICENGQKLIVCSDRMITASSLSQEFEHNSPKMEEISHNCLAVSAGAALVPRELFSGVREWALTVANTRICDVVDEIKKKFNNLRLKTAEELYIKSRGFENIQEFYARSTTLPPQIVIPLDEKIASKELEVEILVAGVDVNGAHIYFIQDPGISNCFDYLGYSAVGSGEPHALHTFISAEYDISFSLKKALLIVYEAKKHAENAPGVGTKTDIWIIENKCIKIVNKDIMDQFEIIYNKKKTFLRGSAKEIEGELQKLNLNDEQNN